MLYNKIAEYNSEGTIEDIISIFKTVSGAESVELIEIGIAGIAMTAYNANPIVDTSLIVESVSNAKAARIKIDYIILQNDEPFGFEAAIDSKGFGEGEFSTLTYHPPVFAFSGATSEFIGGFGEGGFL